jgi:hypothetical protein
MNKLVAVGLALGILASTLGAAPGLFRPPAVPLITHDPYFSIWSFADRLTDDWPRHWTGARNALCGLIRVDGHALRLVGPSPRPTPAMEQKSLRVGPTRTEYVFESPEIRVVLTFTSPLLPTTSTSCRGPPRI